MNDLLYLMARLRDPESGCPWDLEQDFTSIAPYTLEEACEVVQAIETGDMVNFREELGDLLFQVVFHAQMAKEAGQFEFEDVVSEIQSKLIRRHPHVFPMVNCILNAIRHCLFHRRTFSSAGRPLNSVKRLKNTGSTVRFGHAGGFTRDSAQYEKSRENSGSGCPCWFRLA